MISLKPGKKIAFGLGILFFLLLQLGYFILNSPPSCEKLMKAEDFAFAETYLALLKEGRVEEAALLLPEKDRGKLLSSAGQLKMMLEKTSGLPRQTVGCHFYEADTNRSVELIFQWASAEKVLAGSVAWEDGEKPTVLGVNLKILPEPLEETHALRLASRGPVHLVFFLLVILIPLFMIFTAIDCWRSQVVKRKWLWLIFILFGFWQFALNWTSGEIAGPLAGSKFQLLSFHLLGAGFFRSNEFMPFVFWVSFPLGAFLYWGRKRMLTQRFDAATKPCVTK